MSFVITVDVAVKSIILLNFMVFSNLFFTELKKPFAEINLTIVITLNQKFI